jgi:two-component system OmpR family response regulator
LEVLLSPTIFIIEDDPKIARIVKAYVEGAGFKAHHFNEGLPALEAARQQLPDLVILDLMLPDISGEELFLDLRALGDIPVIMVTSKSSEEERVAGLALGADDYVVKPFSPRELAFRVQAVLKRFQGTSDSSGKVLSFDAGRLVLDGQTFGVNLDGQPVTLTASEFRILFALAEQPGRIFTREELIEKALDYHFEGYDRTVDAHIKNIRKKIESDPRKPEYVQTVYGVGYRFGGKKDV